MWYDVSILSIKQRLTHKLLIYIRDKMTKVDENIQTAQNMLSWIVERCYELEEENKKLNEYNRRLKQGNEDLKEQNKKLKETIKDHQLYEEKLEHRIIELEELLHWE